MRLQLAVAFAVAAAVFGAGCGGEETSDGSIPVTTVREPQRTTRYSIPSSAMEPTLHCARPGVGCEATSSDEVVAESPVRQVERGNVVVYDTPALARSRCGAGGKFLHRVIGLPGERLELRSEGGLSYVYINGKKLDEPYIDPSRRDAREPETFQIPAGQYFVMGDNRSQSCDSREWGTVPTATLVGRVIQVVRRD